MVVCSHAKARIDPNGRIEYYCTKLLWCMELDGLETCRECPYYACEHHQTSSK